MKICIESVTDKNVTYAGFRTLFSMFNFDEDTYDRHKKACEKLSELGYVDLKEYYSNWSLWGGVKKEASIKDNFTVVELDKRLDFLLNKENLVAIQTQKVIEYRKQARLDGYICDGEINISDYSVELDLCSSVRLYVALGIFNKQGINHGTYKQLTELTGMTNSAIQNAMDILGSLGLLNCESELSVNYIKSQTKKQKQDIGDKKERKGSVYFVYRFKDVDGNIVYVGRTNSLKRRMNQHFSSKGHLGKEQYEQVNSIEYIELGSKIEMDIKELYYIDKWKPEFNTKSVYEELSCVNLAEDDEWISFKDSMIDSNTLTVDLEKELDAKTVYEQKKDFTVVTQSGEAYYFSFSNGKGEIYCTRTGKTIKESDELAFSICLNAILGTQDNRAYGVKKSINPLQNLPKSDNIIYVENISKKGVNTHEIPSISNG